MKRLLLVVIVLASLVVGCDRQGGGQDGSRGGQGQRDVRFKVDSNWTAVHKSREGRTFTDNATLNKANHQGQFLIQLPTTDDGTKGYTIKATYEADCRARKVHRISGETIGPQGDSFGSMPDPGWQPVRAGTSTEAVYTQLCGR